MTGEWIGAFIAVTLWCHGPWSPLLVVSYEPVLLAFGQRNAPMALALVGAIAATVAEAANYLLYGRLLRLRALERTTEGASAERVRRWFLRWPMVTVWVGIFTPIPDWAVRIAAVHARYSPARYLTAVFLARVPRFWIFASVGALWQPRPGLLWMVVAVTVLVALWSQRTRIGLALGTAIRSVAPTRRIGEGGGRGV